MDTHFRLKLRRLIEFFDERPDGKKYGRLSSIGHSDALRALFSEELLLAMFKDYVERTHDVDGPDDIDKLKDIDKSSNISVDIFDKCNSPGRRGKQLDGWVKISQGNKLIYYQAEVKHASAHSYGAQPRRKGKTIRGKKETSIEEHRKRLFAGTLKNPNDYAIWKVLDEMTLPESFDEKLKIEIRSLLCLWDPIHEEGKENPFFKIDLKKQFGETFFNRTYKQKQYKDNRNEEYCWVFSASNYARYLIKNKIDDKIIVDLKDTSMRLKWIYRILRPHRV